MLGQSINQQLNVTGSKLWKILQLSRVPSRNSGWIGSPLNRFMRWYKSFYGITEIFRLSWRDFAVNSGHCSRCVIAIVFFSWHSLFRNRDLQICRRNRRGSRKRQRLGRGWRKSRVCRRARFAIARSRIRTSTFAWTTRATCMPTISACSRPAISTRQEIHAQKATLTKSAAFWWITSRRNALERAIWNAGTVYNFGRSIDWLTVRSIICSIDWLIDWFSGIYWFILGFFFTRFCSARGAAVGCAIPTCSSTYHYPCGVKNKCYFQFTGTFESYCPEHIPKNRIPRPKDMSTVKKQCTICLEEPNLRDKMDTIITPCCLCALHRDCLAGLAVNAGKHYLKCPSCNVVDNFKAFCEQVNFAGWLFLKIKCPVPRMFGTHRLVFDSMIDASIDCRSIDWLIDWLPTDWTVDLLINHSLD